MDTVEQIISDEQIKEVFEYTNFGSTPHRQLIKNTLLKYVCGYASGRTIKAILLELKLIRNDIGDTPELTKLGQEYLWAAYSGGISV